MSMNRPGTSSPAGGEPSGDPWAAFGYMVAGVVFYGGVGFGLSVWLNASYLVPIGIVVGAGFGIYMVFARYRFREDDVPTAKGPQGKDIVVDADSQSPIDHDPPPPRRVGDDRGEQ